MSSPRNQRTSSASLCDPSAADTSVEGIEPLKCPNGLFNFFPECQLVTDADEEVMELYMELANVTDIKSSIPGTPTGKSSRRSTVKGNTEEVQHGGLGFMDGTKSVLDIDMVIEPPTTVPLPSPSTTLDQVSVDQPLKQIRNHVRKVKAGPKVEPLHISVQLQQDLGLLKASKGDTGSVLWRSSYFLAKHLLTQHHFPPRAQLPLLDQEVLSTSRILELGCGTGLLAILLRKLCASYTASDRLENLKLVKRNLDLNRVETLDKAGLSRIKSPSAGERDVRNTSRKNQQKIDRTGSHSKIIRPKSEGKGTMSHIGNDSVSAEVELEEIDWLAISADRARYPSTKNQAEDDGREGSGYDLILAVDCIYNENLVQPLIDTLVKYCPVGGRTVCWIVIELRSSDVVTLFVDKLLNDPSGSWTIVRLRSDDLGDWDGQKPRWASWVAWRT